MTTLPSHASWLFAADIARILGAALCGWALLAHTVGGGEVSVFTLVFVLAAAVVPLRAGPSTRARAVACFTSGLLVAGILAPVVADWGLWLLLPGRIGVPVPPLQDQLLLAAAVLFAVGGGLFWTSAREGVEP